MPGAPLFGPAPNQAQHRIMPSTESSAAIAAHSGQFPALKFPTDADFIRHSAHPIDNTIKTRNFKAFSAGLTDAAFLSTYNIIYTGILFIYLNALRIRR
jgi:hypothetical protein